MNKNKNIKKNKFSYYWVYVFLVVVVSSYWMFGSFLTPDIKKIKNSEEFKQYVTENKIEKIEFVEETGYAEIYMNFEYIGQNQQINSKGPHYK